MTMIHGDNRPVLITGGCGFIGCNLADRLAGAGHDVVVFDNFGRDGVKANAQWLKARHGARVQIAVGDVRDPILVIDAVRQASAVLHLAAQVAVTSSLESPLDDFEVNARGTVNVLEAVRLHNAAAPLVLASTNKVYGPLFGNEEVLHDGRRYAPADAALAKGVSEAAALDFYSPYGCSKGAADQYVRDYSRVFGMRTAVMRMSCIYGPRQFGTEDQGWLAHFLLTAIRGEKLTIYGDGCQVRDALFVDDAVDAWLALLRHVEAGKGHIFNLGGGPENSISLLELIDLITELTGHSVDYGFADWRPGDQPWYVSDVTALSSAVGWRPTTPLAKGLGLLEGWLRNRIEQNDARGALA